MASVRDTARLLIKGLAVGDNVTRGADKFRITQSQKAINNVVSGLNVRGAGGRFAGYAPLQEKAIEIALEHLATQIMLLLEENLERLTGQQQFTLAQLRAKGHPYAKSRWSRGLGGTRPEQYVNSQTGRMAGSFTFSEVTRPTGLSQIFIANAQPEAGWTVAGTHNRRGGVGAMIARPYDAAAVMAAKGGATADIEHTAELIASLGGDRSRAQMPTVRYNLGGVRRDY